MGGLLFYGSFTIGAGGIGLAGLRCFDDCYKNVGTARNGFIRRVTIDTCALDATASHCKLSNYHRNEGGAVSGKNT